MAVSKIAPQSVASCTGSVHSIRYIEQTHVLRGTERGHRITPRPHSVEEGLIARPAAVTGRIQEERACRMERPGGQVHGELVTPDGGRAIGPQPRRTGRA